MSGDNILLQSANKRLLRMSQGWDGQCVGGVVGGVGYLHVVVFQAAAMTAQETGTPSGKRQSFDGTLLHFPHCPSVLFPKIACESTMTNNWPSKVILELIFSKFTVKVIPV